MTTPACSLRLRHGLAVGAFACAGLAGHAAAAAQAFVPQDIEICAAEFDVVDPEFDVDGSQLAYMTTAGEVRVARMRTDGFVDAPGCAGELVGRDAIWTLPDKTYRQGPEWALSQSGPELFYTKSLPDDRFALVSARRDDHGWQPNVLTRGENRGMQITSKDAADPQSRVMYLRRNAAGKYVPSWRESTLPKTEASLPVSGNASSGGVPRWVPGERQMSTAALDDAGVYQAAVVSIDDRSVRLLTTGPDNKDEVWLWRAPEFGGDWAMITVVDSCCLRIYREVDRIFREVNSYDVRALSGLSKIYSPEPFVVGGRSYISFQASNIKLDKKAQIWFVAADPAAPLARQVSDASVRAVRIEPEWLVTASGVFIYYTQYDSLKRSALRRAATGIPY